MAQRRIEHLFLAAVATVALAACGGGGGGSPAPAPAPAPTPPPPAGLPVAATLAQQCSPQNTLAPADKRTASLDQERRWVRSYVNEAYLWYSEVPSVDVTLPAFNVTDVPTALDNYFEALKTTAVTPSGKKKDQFSFTYPTAEWNALTQSGTSAGYGVEWYLGSPTPPRNIRVAYVDPGTPGAVQGIARGMTLVSVNGVSANDATQAGVGVLNEALFAPKLNTAYSFVLSTGSGQQNATVTATTVTTVPVQNVKVLTTANGKVGYFTFNTHILPAESQLIAAFSTLASQGVNDLVLDMRYNGGGFLYLASQLGYMIAGGTRTSGKTFEKLLFNDKRTADNNDPDNNTPFYNITSGIAGSNTVANQPLPQLNLNRVFILTSRGTCSASESLVNALRGVDVEVVLIGATTCGKPYGFTAKDNCGISYFPIEFKGANNKGFGDYADGFTAACNVADDLSKALGDPAEGQLAAALTYRATGACPPASSVALARAASAGQGLGQLVRSPARENKYRMAPR